MGFFVVLSLSQVTGIGGGEVVAIHMQKRVVAGGAGSAIVTAADANHTSFGCEEDRDLTWFGEAFLKDALPDSATLEDAFRKASALITQREAADHQIHSNPQLYVGDAMKRKLAALEAARPAQGRHSFTVRR